MAEPALDDLEARVALARRRALEMFTLKRSVDQYDELYRATAAAHRATVRELRPVRVAPSPQPRLADVGRRA